MKMPGEIRVPQLGRRDFVFSILAGALLARRWPGLALPQAPQFPFEEILPEKSGIRWVHSSGKSPKNTFREAPAKAAAFLTSTTQAGLDFTLGTVARPISLPPPTRFATPTKST